MQKLIKIFVITVVLLVPVIVFLFLKQFGSNEFTLPVYYEQGNPLQECASADTTHRLSDTLIARYPGDQPLLFTIEGDLSNEFEYDLRNILAKYPEVRVEQINLAELPDQAQLNILNCELVLGEDRYITKPILNKYVLVDREAQIRGYFKVDDLDEINRLDMELDILLNY